MLLPKTHMYSTNSVFIFIRLFIASVYFFVRSSWYCVVNFFSFSYFESLGLDLFSRASPSILWRGVAASRIVLSATTHATTPSNEVFLNRQLHPCSIHKSKCCVNQGSWFVDPGVLPRSWILSGIFTIVASSELKLNRPIKNICLWWASGFALYITRNFAIASSKFTTLADTTTSSTPYHQSSS